MLCESCYDIPVDTEGVKELWLTSEDTGTYGRDIGTSLPELLWQLVDVIPDGCMMRVGMTNPPYILEHLKVAYEFNVMFLGLCIHACMRACVCVCIRARMCICMYTYGV